MKRVIATSVLLALAGCISQQAILQNAKGEQRQCRSIGIGDIGVLVSLAAQHACVVKARKAGFTDDGKPYVEPLPPPPNPNAFLGGAQE